MEKIIKKPIFKKLIILIIAIMLFNVIVPTKVVRADDANDASVAEKVGGRLLSPIGSLIIGLGDVIMNFMQKILFDVDSSIAVACRRDTEEGWFWTILVGIVVAVGVAVAVYFSAGAALAILAKILRNGCCDCFNKYSGGNRYWSWYCSGNIYGSRMVWR